MSHLDDDTLASCALGDADAAALAHLDTCADCATEVTSLRDVHTRLAAAGGVPDLQAPPARVWDAIQADLAGEDSPPSDAAPAVAPQPSGAEPVTDELAARRRTRTPWWGFAAAAAAGLVVGGVGVAALVNGGQGAAGAVVAQTELTDLATEGAAGSATVREEADGARVLVIDTDFVDLDDAYLEVWLIDESIEGMVSLGHLTGSETEFAIPAGFDIGAFPIVDISVEPLDGVPTHSGDSVTRGVLDA